MLLENLTLQRRMNMLYQHDGAPPHFTNAVRDHLNVTFPDRWMGRNGPILWPARSPDLTPLDYFLWGHIKEIVYKKPTREREQCVQKIDAAFEVVKNDEEMVRRALFNIRRRAALVVQTGGGHIEQHL